MFSCSTIRKSCDLKTTATKAYIICKRIIYPRVPGLFTLLVEDFGE